MDRDQAREAYAELDDDQLAPWELVELMHDWTNLLVGNGASLAVWSRFGYRSLAEAAEGLTDEDRAVFDALKTQNFESVLRGLRTAEHVGAALELDTGPYSERYESVREALVAAVHHVHVPWVDLDEVLLGQIKAGLTDYQRVFSTNYDLILYWAAMSEEEPGAIPDFFWNRDLVFDPHDVEVWGKATELYFLHGGLHLLHLADGRTRKRRATMRGNLLETFGDVPDDATPLFVSEGASEDKLAAIRRSEYLSFVLRAFEDVKEPLVVFGHSLSDQDQHIVDVLQRLTRPIAISLRPSEDPAELTAQKDRLRGRLYNQKLIFYDSATHPLGLAELHVG